MVNISQEDIKNAAINSAIVLGSGVVVSKVSQISSLIPHFDVMGVTLLAFVAGGAGLLIKELLR